MDQPPASSPVRYTDSHVHLDRYSDDEVAAILDRAQAAGVSHVLTVGTQLLSSARAMELTVDNDMVLAAIGMHPLELDPLTWDTDVDFYKGIHDYTFGDYVAVGEIGLDWTRNPSAQEREWQRALFERQLEFAMHEHVPVLLHVAGEGAHEAAAARLAVWRPHLPGAVVHYFTGDAVDLRRYRELDCHISFGRPLLKPDGASLRALAQLVPPDRLLVETDSYPLPGRTTEPRDVVDVVHALATARGEEPEHTAALTSANFDRLFVRGY